MVMAAELSTLGEEDRNRVRALIEAAGLPGAAPAVGAAALREAMGMDKKVQQKQLRFVLLDGLGSAYVTTDYDEAALARLLQAAD